MHFEILVEDQSGKKALDILVPKILGNGHTFAVHSYKGVGHIPRDIAPHMNITRNMSPSFCYFRAKLQELAGAP